MTVSAHPTYEGWTGIEILGEIGDR